MFTIIYDLIPEASPLQSNLPICVVMNLSRNPPQKLGVCYAHVFVASFLLSQYDDMIHMRSSISKPQIVCDDNTHRDRESLCYFDVFFFYVSHMSP